MPRASKTAKAESKKEITLPEQEVEAIVSEPQVAEQEAASVGEPQNSGTEAETARNGAESAQEPQTSQEGLDTPPAPAGEDSGRVAALEAQVQMLMEQLAQKPPAVIQMANDEEMVHFLWQAEMSPENAVTFGEQGMYGRIVGKTGSFYVPKRDLSRMLDERTRVYLDRRWLIVVSGLSDEEREALGVRYGIGELLDKKHFHKLIEIGDEILNIYPHLCESHQIIVSQRYNEAYQEGNPHVTRERVVKLNEMSRKARGGKGDFYRILMDMNAQDVPEEEI